ncbi:hypothetical protein MMC29_001737, partial [Sticta canariensis]|nr:hypothetical protein [Sticta canariensis]
MSLSGLQISPADLAYQTAHIHKDKRPFTVAALAILSVLSTMAVILKLGIRWRMRAGFKEDDYTIILALIFGWISFVTCLYDTRYGIGLHIIAIPLDDFKLLLKVLSVTFPVYFIGVALTQISILFLYRRLFTLIIGWFRATFYCLLVLSAGSGIAISLAGFLRCMPISYNWDPTIRGAHCGVDLHRLAVTSCVISLVMDLCIVAAPMPLVWKLHVNFATKAALTGMFLLAGCVCISNLVKLVYSLEAMATDFTFDVRILIWTHAELTLGIVSACLPCYKPFFIGLGDVFSTVFSSRKSISATNPNSMKPADAFHSSDPRKKPGLPGSQIELVSVDEWSDASKPPVVKAKPSAESSLAPCDIQR